MPEWNVKTECGRNFIWSAPDREFLERDLKFRGYRAIDIQRYVEPVSTSVLEDKPKVRRESA